METLIFRLPFLLLLLFPPPAALLLLSASSSSSSSYSSSSSSVVANGNDSMPFCNREQYCLVVETKRFFPCRPSDGFDPFANGGKGLRHYSVAPYTRSLCAGLFLTSELTEGAARRFSKWRTNEKGGRAFYSYRCWPFAIFGKKCAVWRIFYPVQKEEAPKVSVTTSVAKPAIGCSIDVVCTVRPATNNETRHVSTAFGKWKDVVANRRIAVAAAAAFPEGGNNETQEKKERSIALHIENAEKKDDGSVYFCNATLRLVGKKLVGWIGNRFRLRLRVGRGNESCPLASSKGEEEEEEDDALVAPAALPIVEARKKSSLFNFEGVATIKPVASPLGCWQAALRRFRRFSRRCRRERV